MANQSPDRRQILAMLAQVAAISQVPGFSKWAFASDADHAHGAAAPLAAPQPPYQPQFFTPTEYSTLDLLCELIIPADDTPGAHQAGVSEFIDFMVSRDQDLQYPFRTGLAWLNAYASKMHGGPFLQLSAADQEALLTAVASRGNKPEDHQPGREFFSLARQYTVIGFYTSRVGLQSLDYPGLRFYSASPECPHKDDPEHTHLPKPS